MRRLVATLLVLGVVLVIALIGGTALVNQQTRSAVQARSADALGVTAHLDRASVGILTGNFTLTGYRLDNPQGFGSPTLLQMADGDGSLRLSTLFADVIELPHLTLRNIEMHLERRETQGNYDIVLTTLRRSEQAPEEGRRYVIRELLLESVTVHIDVASGVPGVTVGDIGRLTVSIPELRVHDVGTDMDRGVVIEEIVGTLLKAILAAAFERAGDELPDLVNRELERWLVDLDPIAARAIEGLGELLDDLPLELPRDLDPREFLRRRE